MSRQTIPLYKGSMPRPSVRYCTTAPLRVNTTEDSYSFPPSSPKVGQEISMFDGYDPLEHTNIFQRAESDDSDEEGGMGNVNRVVLRPPGHSGKAKKGHLCFDASYETGNLGKVDHVTEYEYDLYIRPDTCNPRFRFWFNFTVDNVRTDQKLIFNIINFSKAQTLFRDGMTPLVKSTSRQKWTRLPQEQVFYHKSIHHQNHYILSFAFAFDREDDVYQFALNYPYSYSRCQAISRVLEDKAQPHIQRQVIGQSLQKRSIEMISISNAENLQDKNKSKTIFIMARSHPGETPTSFVCQGLMEFIISNHPVAVTLREFLIFRIIPMMNPDGVFLGNQRCSLIGADLNRAWHDYSQWAHPCLHVVYSKIKELEADKNTGLDFVIDLHAHNSLLGAFIYGNTYEDFLRYERHMLFPKLLAPLAEDFCPANCLYNRDVLKAGTARRFLADNLRDSINVYTLNVSMMGYQPSGSDTVTLYTEETYQRLGRNLARAFLEYYRLLNHIPSSYPACLLPPPNRVRFPPHTYRPKKLKGNEKNPEQSTSPSAIEFPTLQDKESLPNPNLNKLSIIAPEIATVPGGKNKALQLFRHGDDVRKVGGGGTLSRTSVLSSSLLSCESIESNCSRSAAGVSIIDFSSLAKTRSDIIGVRTNLNNRRRKTLAYYSDSL